MYCKVVIVSLFNIRHYNNFLKKKKDPTGKGTKIIRVLSMKWYSTVLVTREMHIKNTKCHLIPTSLEIIFKSENATPRLQRDRSQLRGPWDTDWFYPVRLPAPVWPSNASAGHDLKVWDADRNPCTKRHSSKMQETTQLPPGPIYLQPQQAKLHVLPTEHS